MPLAEFEEKELKGPLNAQLTGGSGLIWTPGRVLEAIVGIDAALTSPGRNSRAGCRRSKEAWRR